MKHFPIALEGDHFVTTEEIAHEGWDGIVRIIPKGFESDLASLPWWLGWMFPRYSEIRARSAVPHDLFYRLQLDDVSRQAADRMFFRDLMIQNAYVHRAILMYYGLRMFGWYAWWKNGKHVEAARAEVGHIEKGPVPTC